MESPALPLILIILAAAVLVVPVFRRARISPVVGYLVAGSVIGPHVLGWVGDAEAVSSLAEIGVVFLLFSIGLELSLERLVAMRRLVFGLGLVQMTATTAVLWGALALLGAGGPAGFVLASGAAFSSTAIVLRLLEERREMATGLGRASLAVLLLQDLAVVPLLAIVPLMGASDGILLGVAAALLKATLAMLVIVAVGRLLLSRLLRAVAHAHAPELFTGVVLLVALGVGFLTQRAGLSMALGAFLAGLLISETEFRHQVVGDIQPFRGLLLALFFMSIGMGIDVEALFANAPQVLGLTVALLILKATVLTVAARAFRLSAGASVSIGLTLAQSGEFAFVLYTLAVGAGVLEPERAAIGLLVVAITMACTPLLVAAGHAGGRRVAAHADAGVELPPEDLADHVVIAGFGRAGQTLARLLDERNVPYVALDLEPHRVDRARRNGQPVYFGDATRPDVLHAAGAHRAVAAVVTLDEPEASERAVAGLRLEARAIPVLVRARDASHTAALGRAGATTIVPELIEGSLQLGASLLEALGESREDVDRVLDAFRDEEYARLGELAHTGGREGRPPAG